MKKQIKPVILSTAAALAFGAIAVGSTFALFTSSAKTTVNVKSGKIALQAPVNITNAWELGNIPMTENAENNWSSSIGASITKDEYNVIHLDRLAPGDGAEFSFDLDNSETNIKIKSRLFVSLQGELAPALEVEAKQGSSTQFAFKGAGSAYTPWELVNEGENPTSFTVTINFPDGDNGEIVFDSNDNQYQDKEAVLVLGYEAIQGNAYTDDTLEIINTKLATSKFIEGANSSMFDALQDLSEEEAEAILERGYVWGADSDQFFDFDDAPADAYRFFKMYESMPSTQDYSIYAVGDGWNDISNLTVGFDAGETSSITNINYDRSDALEGQEVTIRTNSASQNLTINAPLDTVEHFGLVGALNIIAVANASYHEFGKVAFAEVKLGRLVMEENSSVNHIHINKKDNEEAFNEIVIVDNGASELPAKITRDKIEVPTDDAKLVVTVVSEQAEEQVFVYPYDDASGACGTTEKNETQNADVNSTLGLLVIDDGADAGEKAYSENEKEEQKEIVVIDAEVEEAEEEHEVTYHEALAPTCTVAGHSEYYSYMDGEEEVKIGYKDIPATGHLHVDSETGKCLDCNAQVYYYKVGSNLYKSNEFSAAWAAAKNSENALTLLANRTLNALQVNGAYNIDLNGYTLTLNGHPNAGSDGTTGAAIFIDGGANWSHGNLTLRNGSVNFTATGYAKYGIYNYGSMTLEDLTINSACEYTIEINGQAWGSAGTTVLNNVTINSTHSNGYGLHALALNNWAGTIQPTVEMYDTVITSTKDAVELLAVNATIQDCTFAGNNNSLFIGNSAMASGVVGNINMSGTVLLNAGTKLNMNGNHVLAIGVGSYNFDPSNYLDDSQDLRADYDELSELWNVTVQYATPK